MVKGIIYFISIIHFISILLALIKKDFWIFRIFDYPRMQKFVMLSLLLFLLIGCYWNKLTLADYILIGLSVLSLIYLAYLIIPFTRLGKTMIKRISNPSSPALKILVANVFQENRQYTKVLSLIQKKDADIVFLVEINHQWHNELKTLEKKYPYSIQVPRENTYGMLFYSKHPIVTHEVNYLIDPEVPSIAAEIRFSNELIKIFALHPTPPTPNENLYSTDRDAEILTVAKKVKELDQPGLVIGDLNDVAWSYTTELFLKTSGLLDPRRGRGFYNTFNANYALFRWPLDHFFVSPHFRLVDMKVEQHVGSDHFPISISLVLDRKDESGKLKASPSDRKLSEEKADGHTT